MARIPLVKPRPPATQRKALIPRPTIVIPVFDQLLPTIWRDIEFPVSEISISFSQDQAEHKYWGVDGAVIEGTGRAPMTIEAKIPFFLGVVPGRNEKWASKYELYPTGFRKFVRAMADPSADYLQHPELGDITVKPKDIRFTHDPQRRDGVEVTATWIEHIDDDPVDSIAGESPRVLLSKVATNLDASADDIRGLAPDAPVFEETLDTLVNKVTGFVDRGSTITALAANKPAQIRARADRLKDSIVRARTPLGWPVVDACERISAAARDLHTAVTKGSRKVLRYTTTARRTLAGLQADLPGMSVSDLIRLNPNLLARPEVPERTVIRYYAP